jgi:4-hydroxybenzoate polyprenyltransferase
MHPANTTSFRTLITLGRVSGLPTVWSNCFAGWWLGGGGTFGKLPFLLLGVSALYLGGMFLNDAFDADSDRQRRKERPVPSGKISEALVWKTSFYLLATGMLLTLVCGRLPAFATAMLIATILLYDFSHKIFTASPWLLGACRFWVYIIAAATGADGLDGWVVFGGVALAVYATGAEYLRRRKTARSPQTVWPVLLLLLPAVVALIINTGDYFRDAACLSAVLLLWLARCLRAFVFGREINPPWLAANLMAGIALVDWLAVGPVLPRLTGAIVFLSLFGLTKLLQKFIPAA